MRIRHLVLLFILIITDYGRLNAVQQAKSEIKIGSKKFTESVILGEIAVQFAYSTGNKPVHRRELGGTRLLWKALLKGEIDIYAEYTGTITREILAGIKIENEQAVRRNLAKYSVIMSSSLGFNNTYAIGMKEELANVLNIRAISDLTNHPDLKFGFTNEFMDRSDGWPGLRDFYSLPQSDVRGLDHDLSYQGLAGDAIDVTDMYSTDAEIDYYNLRTLQDDLNFFPKYDALFLFRADLTQKAPDFVALIKQLEGKISETEMIKMNGRVKLDKISENRVAADFVTDKFTVKTVIYQESVFARIRRHTVEHLILVFISLTAAIIVAIPLGIIAAKNSNFGAVILSIVGIIQTIPSLALLVFMIPLLGIGGPPAIVALFLYSLLPIVRNTHSGIISISSPVGESARGLGLPESAILRMVELPIASRAILTGIKTSAVINIGTATLGALIGAGGYGQPILTGIRLDDPGLILQGAIPAAALALLAQGGFGLMDKIFVPKGLRLKGAE